MARHNKSRTREPIDVGPQTQRSLIALALVVACVAVFIQTRSFEFVGLDDYLYVVRNAGLRDGLTFDAVLRAFQANFGNWIPLTVLSLHLDFQVHGLEAGGYHVTNVILHSLSAVLLFLALSSMTDSIWRSGVVAAVFAIHPLHVESVAWITERKDTLSGVFWMLTLLAYARYCRLPRSVGRYAIVLIFLGLGLMSKPSVVTLPFVLLLLDYWPLGRLDKHGSSGELGIRELRRALFEKLPMFAMVAGASVVTFFVQRASGFVSELEQLSIGLRLANAVESYAIYVWKAIWPTGLAAFYPHPQASISGWSVAVAGLLLVAITVMVLRGAATRPYAVVGWLWFLGTLAPVIGLVQVGTQARADRYMYLPLIGLSILFVWGGAELGRHLGLDRRVLAAMAGSALIALGIAAWIQTATWRDTESLYRQALSVTHKNYLAHRALGSELMLQGRVDEAEGHFESAAELTPNWLEPRLGLADVAMARGQVAYALAAYENVLRKDPEHAAAAGRYGLTLALVGRYAEARIQLKRALAQNEGSYELHRGMSDVEAALGNTRSSVSHGREALRLRPGSIEAANNLAWTLATSHEATIRDPEEAIRLVERFGRESTDPLLLDTLAAAYAAAGKFDLAIEAARRAGQGASPGDAKAIRERLALYLSGEPYIAPDPRLAAPSR